MRLLYLIWQLYPRCVLATYMGNVGHLMQHWTLCEILRIAADNNVPGISFIDAHAMAPWATERKRNNRNDRNDRNDPFNQVRNNLPQGGSDYERTWQGLVPEQDRPHGYPNSAAFVHFLLEDLWNINYSMLLCEKECRTADEIQGWLFAIRRLPNCQQARLFHGDWRDRFRRGLMTPAELGLPDNSLTLVSFDPYSYRIAQPPRLEPDDGWLYAVDLTLVHETLEHIGGPTIIQLSTYGLGGAAHLDQVAQAVDATLQNGQDGSFNRIARVQEGDNMMSLIYTRQVGWEDQQLAGLPDAYAAWRGGN